MEENRNSCADRIAQTLSARYSCGMKSNNFRHTHFVGVPVPPEIEDSANEFRAYMNGNFGCSSGHGTPPHITLLPPFAISSEFTERDVLEAAQEASALCAEIGALPFRARLSGFGSFSERTLFVNVADSPEWQKANSVFTKVFARRFSIPQKNGRRFFPHLTIANRDIPTGAMARALSHFAELNFEAEFTADCACLYKRSQTGGWQESRRFFAEPGEN